MNVLVLTLIAEPQTSHAAYSKVATKAATKVAKEIGADIAVQMAEDILFNYQMEQWLSGKYDTDPGYTAVCLDKKTSEQNGKCDKPAQVKQVKTATDKKVIANKVEEVLERKVGMNGWKKFLDWFVPIFLVSGIVTWISHKFDSDTDGMFDEVAKESLQETGFMKSVKPNVTEVITKPGGGELEYPELTPIESPVPVHKIPDISVAQEVKFVATKSYSSRIEMATPEVLQSVGYLHIQRNIYNQDPLFAVNDITVGFGDALYMSSSGTVQSYVPARSKGGNVLQDYARIDGYKNGTWIDGTHLSEIYGNVKFSALPLNKITDIMIYPVQLVAGSASNRRQGYTNLSMNYLERKVTLLDADGNNYDIYTTSRGFNGTNAPSVSSFNQVTHNESHSILQSSQLSVKVHLFTDVRRVEFVDYNPTIEDIPTDIQIVKRGDTVIPPPTAIPIRTPDGTLVQPSTEVPSGWVDKGTGKEVVVNEDDLTVEDVDPSIITTPKPNPEGVEPVPDKEEDKEEDYPSCEKDLEKIEFNKVGTAFTHAFPFSIPWDMKRMIDKAFGGIGDEKPSVELSFLGDGIVLEMPDLIDKWMPFARGLLILLFDIAILMFFYRLMKGDM